MTTEKAKNPKEHSIFIGGKPLMNYAIGITTQFNTGANNVTIKARGKFISKAVDVAELTRRKFLEDKNISTEKISIGSEKFKNKEGKIINISTIEIILKNN